MTSKETPVTPSFLGFVKKGPCPTCGTLMTKKLGTPEVLCSRCGDLLIFKEKTLRQADPATIALGHAFPAPTPWPDMEAPTFGALAHPLAAIDDLIRTKPAGVRVMDAKWPSGCCVCGKPATRAETISGRVTFAPPNGGKPRARLEAAVVAGGVPHCAEHADGARLAAAVNFGDLDASLLGLFFRSHAYQIEFRRLNPWKWRP
jgi:hypothetical protein